MIGLTINFIYGYDFYTACINRGDGYPSRYIAPYEQRVHVKNVFKTKIFENEENAITWIITELDEFRYAIPHNLKENRTNYTLKRFIQLLFYEWNDEFMRDIEGSYSESQIIIFNPSISDDDNFIINSKNYRNINRNNDSDSDNDNDNDSDNDSD